MVSTSTSNDNNFWERIFTLRGLIFSGKTWEDLKNLGYTDSEIKTAATLNQRYFLNKWGNCALIGFS